MKSVCSACHGRRRPGILRSIAIDLGLQTWDRYAWPGSRDVSQMVRAMLVCCKTKPACRVVVQVAAFQKMESRFPHRDCLAMMAIRHRKPARPRAWGRDMPYTTKVPAESSGVPRPPATRGGIPNSQPQKAVQPICGIMGGETTHTGPEEWNLRGKLPCGSALVAWGQGARRTSNADEPERRPSRPLATGCHTLLFAATRQGPPKQQPTHDLQLLLGRPAGTCPWATERGLLLPPPQRTNRGILAPGRGLVSLVGVRLAMPDVDRDAGSEAPCAHPTMRLKGMER